MPRTALALVASATLLLNGSMAAAATIPAVASCSDPEAVCVISLRMMSPPPPRPTTLLAQQDSTRQDNSAALLQTVAF